MLSAKAKERMLMHTQAMLAKYSFQLGARCAFGSKSEHGILVKLQHGGLFRCWLILVQGARQRTGNVVVGSG